MAGYFKQCVRLRENRIPTDILTGSQIIGSFNGGDDNHTSPAYFYGLFDRVSVDLLAFLCNFCSVTTQSLSLEIATQEDTADNLAFTEQKSGSAVTEIQKKPTQTDHKPPNTKNKQ